MTSRSLLLSTYERPARRFRGNLFVCGAQATVTHVLVVHQREQPNGESGIKATKGLDEALSHFLGAVCSTDTESYM